LGIRPVTEKDKEIVKKMMKDKEKEHEKRANRQF